MKIFDLPYANSYDLIYAEKNYRHECDIIEELAKRFLNERPKTILDIGCGTGGHALELTSRGYIVTGVDQSKSMLDIARQKSLLAVLKKDIEFLQGDIRTFKISRQFDLGIMMFAVAGYLIKNEDILNGLSNIRKHLKEGSLLVCDFWSGISVLVDKPSDRLRVINADDHQIIRCVSTSLKSIEHTAEVRIRTWLTAKNRLEGATDETHIIRYFFPQEFSFFLQQAGFELCQFSEFPSVEKPVNENSWNILAVARAV